MKNEAIRSKFAALVKSFWSMTLAKSDQTKPNPKTQKTKKQKKKMCKKLEV